MPPPAASKFSFRNMLRRFRRNRRGSAAIEFALVGPMFFALLFAIIETALVFFAGQVLETGVQNAARQIFTHQLQDSGLTTAQALAKFKQDLCDNVSALLSCPLDVDVRYFQPGTPITISNPVDAAGHYDSSNLVFQVPPAGSPATIVVRGFYQWPLFVTGLGYNIANIHGVDGNKFLLAATAAFHVEP
jgi:Flp pilus assembly protein TadG